MTHQLQLLDLPAVEPPVPAAKSWQQSFAGIFWFKYKEATGDDCKLGFGALKKMLNLHAVKYWVDEETGSPELPSIDQWTDEVNAFFEDPFAAKERGFHFAYLLKQYGSFKKYVPKKREAASDVMLTYQCTNPECKREIQQPRSKWMRYRNQTAVCSKCKTQFNVNDVLNKQVSIKDLLPGREQ
jgi:uncharacterized protein YktA (UPF0223 family)